MHYRQYRFTNEDLAEVTGKSVEAIRQDIYRGKLDPNDLLSVLKYVSKYVYLGK